MSRATAARPVARTPTAQRLVPAAAPVRRRRWARAVVPLGVATVLGATWSVVRASGIDRSDARPTPSSVVLRRIGAPRVAALDGAAGAVTLHVVAELRDGARAANDTVPAGAPVTFTIETRAAAGATAPTLTAERLAADGAVPTALDHHETFLYNGRDGTFVLRHGAGATAGALGEDAGATLSRLAPAGGAAWATTIGAHAGPVVADPTGRWVAVAQPAAGRVDLIDLVARAGPLAAPVGGRPMALAFAPADTTLWVATDGSGLVAVDLPAGDVHRVAGIGDAHAVAVSDDGAHVLAIGTDGQARLVDAATRRVVAMRPASADVVTARYVGSLDGGAFVCVGRGGLVRVLPVRGSTLTTDRAVETGPAGARDVGGALVAPDGRTLLVSDRVADEVVVVDLAAGHVVDTIAAGTDPADIERLDHFAIVRSAATAAATWVDLDDTARSGAVAIGGAPASSLAGTPGAAEVLAPVPADARLYRLRIAHGQPTTVASDGPVTADVAVDVMGTLHALGTDRFEQRAAFDTPGRYRLTFTIGGHRATWELDVG